MTIPPVLHPGPPAGPRSAEIRRWSGCLQSNRAAIASLCAADLMARILAPRLGARKGEGPNVRETRPYPAWRDLEPASPRLRYAVVIAAPPPSPGSSSRRTTSAMRRWSAPRPPSTPIPPATLCGPEGTHRARFLKWTRHGRNWFRANAWASAGAHFRRPGSEPTLTSASVTSRGRLSRSPSTGGVAGE